MSDSKIIFRKVEYEYSEGGDDTPGPATVDAFVDGKHVMSASGADYSLAGQNLIDKMRAAGFSEDDLWTAKNEWHITLGEPSEPLPDEE